MRDEGNTGFVVDTMLGKLAKWLRVLGYDALYRSFYEAGAMDLLLRDGRRLLSRHEKRVSRYQNAVLIHADQVGAQLIELREKIGLTPEKSRWFSRCLLCNVLLEQAPPDETIDRMPEFVFYNNASEIRACPSCDRLYWPGSHRKRMVIQINKWGFE